MDDQEKQERICTRLRDMRRIPRRVIKRSVLVKGMAFFMTACCCRGDRIRTARSAFPHSSVLYIGRKLNE